MLKVFFILTLSKIMGSYIYKNSFMKPRYTVEAFWDNEAQVWVAQSDDAMRLVTEANTLEALIYKLKNIIPELLEVNNLRVDNAKKVI